MTIVPQVLRDTVRKFGHKEALFQKKDHEWHGINWQDASDQCYHIASFLLHQGIEPKDTIGILSMNRTEWFLSNIASIIAGGVPFGIYPTSSPDQIRYMMDHSKAKIIFVENYKQLLKILSIKDQLTSLKAVVIFEPFYEKQEDFVFSFETVKIAKREDARLQEIESQMKDKDLATLVYTSGTTSHPKAVMLCHQNLNWMADTFFKRYFPIDETDSYLSYLPLSHIAEQMTSIHGPLCAGYRVYFAENMEEMPKNLKEIRPTLFLGVPRVWEKMQAKLLEGIQKAEGMKKTLLSFARKTATKKFLYKSKSPICSLSYSFAEKLVLSKIKSAMGFDRCRLFLTGAAPISKETMAFFYSLGIPIGEVYGMSESAGPITLSLYPQTFKHSSVGKPLEGTSIKIADDGEIIVKGPHVFLGYLGDEKATQQAVSNDGWLATGDMGRIDQDGFLYVTGRKKNLIITAGGENIATEMLEDKIKQIPGIEHAVAVGDQKKYISMLLTLDPSQLDILNQKTGLSVSSLETLVTQEKLLTYLDREIEKINKSLARVQTIKKFVILKDGFSEESGELTPTLKVKRNVVLKKYASVIDDMYV